MILARFERLVLFLLFSVYVCARVLGVCADLLKRLVLIKRDAPVSSPPALWAPAEGSLVEEGSGAETSAPGVCHIYEAMGYAQYCPHHVVGGAVRGGQHSVST